MVRQSYGVTWRVMRGVGGTKAEERLKITAAIRATSANDTRILI